MSGDCKRSQFMTRHILGNVDLKPYPQVAGQAPSPSCKLATTSSSRRRAAVGSCAGGVAWPAASPAWNGGQLSLPWGEREGQLGGLQLGALPEKWARCTHSKPGRNQ